MFDHLSLTWLLAGMLLVFLATTAGALPMMGALRMKETTRSFLLGSSAGVMLGATLFSLILPAIALFGGNVGQNFYAASVTGFCILLGAALVYGLHQIIPHEHFIKGVDQANLRAYSRQLMVILAVGLHNLPEGLAVGVGIGSGNAQLAGSLSVAIALQDIPEGLIVAVSLMLMGVSARQVLYITALTGLVESLGVLIGGVAISLSQAIMPAAFALCAGAMLFVVSHEVIPESHRSSHEKEATIGFMIGFVMMLVLDKGLGI